MPQAVTNNTRPHLSKPHAFAVSSVQGTGLELVRKRKPRGKLATMRDYAKFDFNPWTRSPQMGPNELVPSNQTLINCGVPARIAYAVALKTRAELIKMHGEIEEKVLDEMMTSLTEAAETLKAVVHLLDTAYLRILASACAHHTLSAQRRKKNYGIDLLGIIEQAGEGKGRPAR